MKKQDSCKHKASQFICAESCAFVHWCADCGALRIDLDIKDAYGMRKSTTKGMWEKPKHAKYKKASK